MKKPIDPNLHRQDENDFLLDGRASRQTAFGFNDYAKPKEEDPSFVVTDKDGEHVTADDMTARAISAFSEERSSHHGGHHHSSHHSSHHHHHHHSGSHHYRHHEEEKKKLPLPARIALAILLLLLLAFVAVISTFLLLKTMGHKDIMPVINEETAYTEIIHYNGHQYQYNENMTAFGFVGVDQRTLKNVDETDFVGAGDADIVVAIDTKSGAAKVIAIPRDTMTDVDIFSESGMFLRTEKTQLCLAYAYGDGGEKSCEGAIKAMSRVLYNVPIQKYFILNLDGIAPLNDAIGGVTLQSLYNFKNEGIHVGDSVTLKGDMAEMYVRRRDMDKLDASLNRTDRQVQYVRAYAQQVLPAVLKDFSTVSSLYRTASGYSKTNLTLSNATYLASLLLSKGVDDFQSYILQGSMKAAQDTAYPDIVHAEFYPDEEQLMQTVLDVFYIQID